MIITKITAHKQEDQKYIIELYDENFDIYGCGIYDKKLKWYKRYTKEISIFEIVRLTKPVKEVMKNFMDKGFTHFEIII